MLKIDLSSLRDAKWYDFETGEVVAEPASTGVFLKIKPYPFSRSKVRLSENDIVITGQEQCKAFKESLEEMANVVGMDGKPVPCTDEAKQKIYDFRLGGIANFVIKKIWTFYATKESEVKNSKG